MQIRLILDMDDVMANFTEAACRVHKLSRAELEIKRIRGKWGMAEALGMSAKAFWEPINELGDEFWAKIHPTPYLESIVELAYNYDSKWLIASSPPPKPGDVGASYNGKIRWLERWLMSADKLEFLRRKYMFASSPGAVLIDDREENIRDFVKHGGVGIIFPHESNSLYAQANNPIPYVSRRLEETRQLFNRE